MNFYEQLFCRGKTTGEGMTHFERLFAAKFGGSPAPEVREYTGAVPATIIADGTPLLDYLITGNTTQSGTPSPTSPVMPEGCGERAGNLANLYGVDTTFLGLHYTVGENMSIVINGTKENGTNVHSLVYPNITLPAGTYTVKVKMVSGNITDLTTDDGLFFGINQSTYGQRTTPGVKQVGDVGKRTFTLANDTLLSSIDIAPSYGSQGSVWTNATFECWFYAGSDDKPYSPSGYKIPISSAGQTTPVYLGVIETTRKIKKLVLDGTENWFEGTSNYYIYIDVSGKGAGIPNSTALSTHTESGVVVNNNGTALFFKKSVFVHSSLADFKTYLQQQYAAGTPVTVWYVLSTETTGIVNEPLMRIGDYADTLSKSQAGVSIPTNNGSTTVDVETTLKPSEVYIKYMG